MVVSCDVFCDSPQDSERMRFQTLSFVVDFKRYRSSTLLSYACEDYILNYNITTTFYGYFVHENRQPVDLVVCKLHKTTSPSCYATHTIMKCDHKQLHQSQPYHKTASLVNIPAYSQKWLAMSNTMKLGPAYSLSTRCTLSVVIATNKQQLGRSWTCKRTV